jgi:hypothetical protein
MKRDPRLHGLTTDHHHALSLATRLARLADAGRLDAGTVAELRQEFDAELAPHFAAEEEILLRPLRDTAGAALAARTWTEHETLRGQLEAAEAGQLDQVGAFAALLREHVHFEERELFPACEALLPQSVLDAVGARVPKR